ncbi:Fic family protein [Achromobacter aloeverae]|nr:Fic family protein [Achromobacter aloeverae]
MGTRHPVSYQRTFVDRYQPNASSLLPGTLAAELHGLGKSKDQQPAGTYARKVLEQLLIDLSWYSSRLEGNRISLLDTRALFEKGRSESDDRDATMLLNHKDAIEFMVDAVPTEGITPPVLRNLQSLLMRDLLPDSADLGAIRQKIVNIQDTVYVPSQVPHLLEETLRAIVDKARAIHNPVEAAFFLWVHLAYLQPFVDGNKRTSRLAANMPLMLANCSPLSFLDVGRTDYALAMLGIYERLDVTLAVELFDWTYRRSIAKYQAIIESMGGPDPLRVRYREQLGEAIQQIVHFGRSLESAVQALHVAETDAAAFRAMLNTELTHLESYNCARYRLPIGKTQAWIDRGRPH